MAGAWRTIPFRSNAMPCIAGLCMERAVTSESQIVIRRRIEIPIKVSWRIGASAPLAVDIDLSEPKSEVKVRPDSPDIGRLQSSRDLLHGLRVRETPMDALPVDLIEAFARKKR